MDLREEFMRRMLSAAHQFRRELAATDDAGEVLPHDAIKVDLTPDGVEVHFFNEAMPITDETAMSMQKIEGKPRSKKGAAAE